MYIYGRPPPRSTLRAFGALQVHLEGLRASHSQAENTVNTVLSSVFTCSCAVDESYSCYCQILELETGIRDLETRGVNWVLSNVKMCFCLLVELSVFVLFCTSSGNGNVFHQTWRGTKENNKTKDFGLFRPRLRHDSKIFVSFVFLGSSSGNDDVFHQTLAFSWKGTKENNKTKDFGLFKPRLRQDSKIFVFFVFLVPPQEMTTFSIKLLHFPGGVPKKTTRPKILDSSGLAFAMTLKSLFLLFFWVPPQEMTTFSIKNLHLPGGVPKNQKNKDFGLFRPRLRQDSKIFVFFFGVPPQEMATFPFLAILPAHYCIL